MEELVFWLIQIFAELLLQVVFELFSAVCSEIALESLAHVGKTGHKQSAGLAILGLVLLGALAGLVSVFLFPHAFFRYQVQHPLFRGASLVLSPIGVGFAMKWVGSWRRKQGQEPTVLAGFWGGAVFAFCVTLVRWRMAVR